MMEMPAAMGAQSEFTQFGRVRESVSEKVNLYWKSLPPHPFLAIEKNCKEYFKIELDSGFQTKK